MMMVVIELSELSEAYRSLDRSYRSLSELSEGRLLSDYRTVSDNCPITPIVSQHVVTRIIIGIIGQKLSDYRTYHYRNYRSYRTLSDIIGESYRNYRTRAQGFYTQIYTI